MRIITLIVLGISFIASDSESQVSKQPPRYMGEPILTDTLSTFFFPTSYNEELLSAHKMAIFGEYYANIIVYDFKNDRSKKLFGEDTYIESFRGLHSYDAGVHNSRLKNLTTKWVFMLVKQNDTNESGRIDENDPSVLYVATVKGENLKPITKESENVVSFEIFNDQNFALIKIQRDSNGDRSFKNSDKEFYYRKIDLNDLALGKEIKLF